MKIVLINKSDRTGGAAVVTFRLMEALRAKGVDARMLVTEKLTDSPWVETATSPRYQQIPFLAERLGIFTNNGFSRSRLFMADTASHGLPLWRHPLVHNADAIILNWINQGMLSIHGLQKIASLGKPLIWTMHDMWCATGICHHAGLCNQYTNKCGDCPLLGYMASSSDISRRTWLRKQKAYSLTKIHFVAVSNWLAHKCRESGLLREASLSVIPNAFPLPDPPSKSLERKRRIIFGAARLDDPVKGFSILIRATELLAEKYPGLLGETELVTFGNIRDKSLLQRIAIPHTHIGLLHSDNEIRELFATGTVALSTSLYETLPGTLIEGQAAGCLAVAFDSGGQSDIIDNGINGFLATFTHGDPEASAASITDALVKALQIPQPNREAIYASVRHKFSAPAVADAYLTLLNECVQK